MQMVLASELKPTCTYFDNLKFQSRLEKSEIPHPLSTRNGKDIEEKLNRCSLYNSNFDNFATDYSNQTAAYCVTWFEPKTAIGVIEPFRTENLFQKKGVGKALLTYSISKLRNRGAKTIKVAFETRNSAAQKLYSQISGLPCVKSRKCLSWVSK